MTRSAYDYGLNDLQMQNFTVRSTTGTDRLQFRVWGGSLRVSVIKEKDFKAIYELTIGMSKIPIIRKLIAQVAKSSPDSKYPAVFSTYDRDTKKWNTECVLSFIKDDKNMYRIEIQWKGNKYEFILRGPSGISYGSDPMGEAERSAIELETLDMYIKDYVPAQTILTNKRRNIGGASNKSGDTAKSNNIEEFFGN